MLIHFVTAAFRQLMKSLKAPLAVGLAESRLYCMLRTGILDVKATVRPRDLRTASVQSSG